MRITIKLYATLTDYLPGNAVGNRVDVELPEGCTVVGALAPFGLPTKLTHLVLVDGTFITPEDRNVRPLKDGEVLAVWPPVAGG
ncbi:MAG TPA: MoaD/ThiS family protein [Azonexus sp.]|nr:MoaD/ThiS family protein [Azonexus sp.]